MKKILRIASFLLLFSSAAFGQHNFFNVPNSEITPKSKSYFQQQVNVSHHELQFNSTYDLGLGYDVEIGINYVQFTAETEKELFVSFNDTARSYHPFLTLNAQKKFEINDAMAVSFGGQLGMTTTSILKSGGYCFSNFLFNKENIGLKTVAGLYYASPSFFGEGNRLLHQDAVGIQAGLQQSILKDKLSFEADFISGQHDFGELAVGGTYHPAKNWEISAGYQLPTFKSHSVHALILGLVYNPEY